MLQEDAATVRLFFFFTFTFDACLQVQQLHAKGPPPRAAIVALQAVPYLSIITTFPEGDSSDRWWRRRRLKTKMDEQHRSVEVALP